MSKKQSFEVNESNSDFANQKYPAKSKGESLAEGLSHLETSVDVDGMYKPTGEIGYMPKGHDQI